MNLVILGIGTQIYLPFKENIHPISGMHFIVNINLYSKTEHMYTYLIVCVSRNAYEKILLRIGTRLYLFYLSFILK